MATVTITQPASGSTNQLGPNRSFTFGGGYTGNVITVTVTVFRAGQMVAGPFVVNQVQSGMWNVTGTGIPPGAGTTVNANTLPDVANASSTNVTFN